MAKQPPSKSWDQQVYDLIHEAYKKHPNFGIREEWVAGLISVENRSLLPGATRFEEGVFKSLKVAQAGNVPKSFPGFATGAVKAYIRNAPDDKLKILATSYGLFQIMGYHYLIKWGVNPEVLHKLTVDRQVEYALNMMGTGFVYAQSNNTNTEEANFKELARWWNTGSINGKTYHADYADNAWKAVQSYKAFLKGINK
jgi:hypothetical protein